jgi:serine/threonine protein kinase
LGLFSGLDEVGVQEKKPNEIVEGYRIISVLGHGAASIVYLVQDPKSKAIWALKHVVREGPKDQRFLDQAESEYEIARRLSHPSLRTIPNIIKNRQYLIGSAKELFLVMEFLDGKALDKHPPKTLTQAVEIFQKVAEGLAHMHDQGYVHADMKPNNIIVDDDGGVKIIDLGQACKIGTVKERIQGTPDYIAPEQVHRQAITPRTDVYNFGRDDVLVPGSQADPDGIGQGRQACRQPRCPHDREGPARLAVCSADQSTAQRSHHAVHRAGVREAPGEHAQGRGGTRAHSRDIAGRQGPPGGSGGPITSRRAAGG